jgi:hypothetical protein
MRRGVLVAALLLGACSQQPPSAPKTKEALYAESGRLFTCSAPASWRVLENQGGAHRVTFLGPADGPAPFSDSISVYYYPKTGSDYATPQDYAKSQTLAAGTTGPLVFKLWKGLATYEFSATRPTPVMHGAGQVETRQESTVLIPSKQGFYAAVYSAPQAGFTQNESAFRDLVDSLRFTDAQ